MGFSSNQPIESDKYALAVPATNYVLSARALAVSCGAAHHHGAFSA
jgi:hypothetical protein